MKRQVAIGLAVSLACLAWVLRELDFGLLWRTIKEVNPLYFLGVNLFLAVSFWLRALRWRIILEPLGETGLANLTWAAVIGLGANNVLPARLGELVRAYALARLERLPASSVLATILVERILDGMALLMFLFLALLMVDPQAKAGAFSVGYLRAAGYGLLAVYLIALAAAAALWRWPGVSMRLVSGWLARLSPRLGQKARGAMESFHQGLAMLGRGSALPAAVSLSILLWLAYLAAYWLFLPAAGLPFSLTLAAMALAGGSLGSAVPAGPGYIGAFQLGVTWALMMAGAGEQEALAYSLLFWAAQYFPLTGTALYLMWKKGMSLGGLQRGGQQLDPEGKTG
ncbi:hypothetical protein AAU61_02460 [Desulfocarbo indianensis]|nr:hypothetical protein AAU61_02460 [Desulfocarbo indianensis]